MRLFPFVVNFGEKGTCFDRGLRKAWSRIILIKNIKILHMSFFCCNFAPGSAFLAQHQALLDQIKDN